MKEKDNIDELFERLQYQFDYEEPQNGHQERFLEKLNRSKGVISISKKPQNWLKPLSIAASIALICVLGYQTLSKQGIGKEQLVEISPEVSKTEFYFAGLIEEQVEELKEAKTPETEKLINDTLLQLENLEADYQHLQNELIEGGDMKLILNAMVINFQTRIDLLQEVLQTIEEIKTIKLQDDENYTI